MILKLNKQKWMTLWPTYVIKFCKTTVTNRLVVTISCRIWEIKTSLVIEVLSLLLSSQTKSCVANQNIGQINHFFLLSCLIHFVQFWSPPSLVCILRARGTGYSSVCIYVTNMHERRRLKSKAREIFLRSFFVFCPIIASNSNLAAQIK